MSGRQPDAGQRLEDVSGRRTPCLGVAGLVLGALAAASAVMAGIGTRLGVWDFRTGLGILKWSAYLALGASILCLAALAAGFAGKIRRGALLPLVGLLLALPAIALPWRMWSTARRVPAIHDITTDTENPPRFVAVLPLRAGAANPSAYGGPEIAEKQRFAYPDVRPAIVPVPPAEAYDRALAAARRLGWRIVDGNAADGRIEATDTTFWFGFKDDVVIRIVPAGGGSRVDVRSVSRVGKSDVGTNAARIRKFLASL